MENLIKHLQRLYPRDATYLTENLNDYLKNIKKVENTELANDWYKRSIMYTVYADGIVYDNNLNPLKNLLLHIPKIKELGCNSMHILPFLESPMVDCGFDVSNYYQVRNSLGSLEDLLAICQQAKQNGIQLFMDFVLNHVSEQHEWAQKAQGGDEHYRKFFINISKKPEYLGMVRKNSAVWAKYKIRNKINYINVAFPELAGEIPHWQQGKDGYWYYHTYYPHELDLNWLNPYVFLEMAKVILYWASWGFNFRLDAIPFVGLPAYKKLAARNRNVQIIIGILKYLITQVNPKVCILVESFETLPVVMNYFGSKKYPKAKMAYNFHLTTRIWLSLVRQDASSIWPLLKIEKRVPPHAEWLNFLRNHDELSLAHLPNSLIKQAEKKLMPFGLPFRLGYGISGRTFSLLGSNVKLFKMAYFLLASLPWGIMLPYGDEIGMENIPLRKFPSTLKTDTRNINRGVVNASNYLENKNNQLFIYMAELFAARKKIDASFKQYPVQLKISKKFFAASYKLKNSKLLVFINLSNKEKTVKTSSTNKILFAVNNVKLKNNNLIVGAFAGAWLTEF